jgi:hypothetical protein
LDDRAPRAARSRRHLEQRRHLLARFGHGVHLAAHERAELEEREAQAVFAALAVLLEDVVLDERRRQAMHRALASPRRPASALIPISYSCSENAFVRRIAFATDDNRMRRGFGFFTR